MTRWAWLLVLGCAPAPTPEPAAPITPQAEPPAWTVADVATELEHALAEGIPQPWTLDARYRALVAQGNELCPGPDNQLQMPESSCETESGYTFYGVATYWDTSTEELDNFYMFTASFVITPPDAEPFRGGGSFRYDEFDDQTWTALVEGVFVDPAEDAWLGLEASAALALAGSTEDDTLSLHGGMAVRERVVWFEDLTFGGACGTHTSGVVQVRDPSGAWYTLDFGDTCSGCGAVSFDGVDLGEACVDLSVPLSGVLAARAAR